MKDIICTSEELRQKNRIILPVVSKDFSNQSFWHYTSLDSVNSILRSRSFYLSSMDKTNDIDEKDMHKEDSRFIHILCFCNSNTEKIPLWYLYAGIAGKGAAIGITPSNMIKLIKSIETVTTPDNSIILKKDVDFDLEYGWVFYRKKESISQVKYKGKRYSLTDPCDFEKDNYFLKSYPWEYEKEFRVLIHNKTGKPHDKLVIDINSVYSELKVKLAPELDQQEFAAELPRMEGVKDFLTAKIMHSKLGIKMDLIAKNRASILEHLASELKESGYNCQLANDGYCPIEDKVSHSVNNVDER